LPVNAPLIAVTATGARFDTAPAVHIEVGVPGVDHDAVDYSADIGGLAPHVATRPSDAPTAAAVLDGILCALPARETAA
jgi:formylmethanofuran dehydrogenase subunit B